MVSGWQYMQFRTTVNRYGTETATLISSLALHTLKTLDIDRQYLKYIIKNSPAPANTYIQLLDKSGRIFKQDVKEFTLIPYPKNTHRVFESEYPDNENNGFSEFYAPIAHGSNIGATVRVAIKTDYVGYVTDNLYALLAGLAPSMLIALVLVFFRNRETSSVAENIVIMQRMFRLLSDDEFKTPIDPVLTCNAHNLKRLLNSTEEFINKMESERSTFITSTRVLGYQKMNSESILRSVPDAVLVLDESGQITFANQQFLRWYRLKSDDVVGKMPQDWCNRAEMLAFFRRYQGMLARRAETGATEKNPPAKPGSTLSLTAYPMFSSRDEKQINSTLVILSDVTAEVMAQNARDEFATALAHELKTPLHSIGLHAESLMGEDGDNHGSRIDSANYINTEVEHISELVRTMLNITRIETGSLSINRKLTKFGDLLNNAMDNLASNAAEKNIVFRKELPDSVEPSYLDKDLLRVAINNILSNAIKYSHSGGEITVTLGVHDNNLVLSVADEGIGISEEDKERVFEKFFRSEDEAARNRSGHGLGLSLVREIIELHNGSVSIESTKGQGTVFTVRLKRINVPLQEAA